MMTSSQHERLVEENELAFFRADVCLGSPQSFSLEEKAKICDDMEATNKAIEEAIRADFQAMPPEAQSRMMQLLAAADPDNAAWWFAVLHGLDTESMPEGCAIPCYNAPRE